MRLNRTEIQARSDFIRDLIDSGMNPVSARLYARLDSEPPVIAEPLTAADIRGLLASPDFGADAELQRLVSGFRLSTPLDDAATVRTKLNDYLVNVGL